MVCTTLMIEDFFCGFGLVGFLVFILYYGRGRGTKVHADACVVLLSFSVMVAGGITGVIQDYFGYRGFFIVVVAAAFVALFTLALLLRVRRR